MFIARETHNASLRRITARSRDLSRITGFKRMHNKNIARSRYLRRITGFKKKDARIRSQLYGAGRLRSCVYLCDEDAAVDVDETDAHGGPGRVFGCGRVNGYLARETASIISA